MEHKLDDLHNRRTRSGFDDGDEEAPALPVYVLKAPKLLLLGLMDGSEEKESVRSVDMPRD